ncbi:MAG: hypothetical protein LIP12_18385, partial [Clostridiales bacterium]|nr:hypothetical protein [Clostridiales bacterium]
MKAIICIKYNHSQPARIPSGISDEKFLSGQSVFCNFIQTIRFSFYRIAIFYTMIYTREGLI